VRRLESLLSEEARSSCWKEHRKLARRVLAPVWEYFHCEKTNSYGHYLAKCSFCSTKWARGEWLKLEAYLALQCPYVEDNIRQSYLLHVASRNNEEESPENLTKSKKLRLDKQNNLSKFFPPKSEDLSEERINSINISLLNAFIVCGILFSIVENTFFINLLQNLCLDYQLPSRKVLSRPEFLVEKIDTILDEVRCDRFTVIVTDNASNMKLTQQTIHEKYPKILSLNCIAHCINLVSKDILIEDNERIIENFEIEEVEYGESDSDNEVFQDYKDEFDELDYDELSGNKMGQGVFDFDPTELAANLVREWDYENNDLNIDNIDSTNTINNIESNTIDKNNASDNISRDSSIIENKNEALESLPIVLRKTCCQILKR
ncbi:9647_t:CDS:2, partial [Cetraspora pellucida]